MGPLIGPVVGPIAGGFLGQEAGWRWVFWLLLIVGGVVSFGVEILNKETYADVLIRWKTEKLAKETGRTDLRSAYDTNQERVGLRETLMQSFKRPILLLFKSPIVFLLCVYMVSLTSIVTREIVLSKLRSTDLIFLVFYLRSALPFLHHHPGCLHPEIRFFRRSLRTCIPRYWFRFHRRPCNDCLHKRPDGYGSY